MHYETAETGHSLTGAIRALWYLDAPRVHEFEQVLPMPETELIVNLSDPYWLHDEAGERRMVPRVFLTGIRERVVAFENPRRLHHVAVRMPVFGPARFGIVPSNTVAEVGGELGGVLSALADRSAPVEDPQRILTDVRHALEQYIRPETDAQRTARVVATELLAEPTRPIADVAEGVGMSHKTLIEHFRRATGTTPSRVVQLIMVDAVVRQIPVDGPFPTWTRLVAESPYADQSHFIRSFKRMLGLTPREYLDAPAHSRYLDPRFLPGRTPG